MLSISQDVLVRWLIDLVLAVVLVVLAIVLFSLVLGQGEPVHETPLQWGASHISENKMIKPHEECPCCTNGNDKAIILPRSLALHLL